VDNSCCLGYDCDVRATVSYDLLGWWLAPLLLLFGWLGNSSLLLIVSCFPKGTADFFKDSSRIACSFYR